MINRRFLNYKLYSSFKQDLNDGQISKDAIVFIQDESHPCIWTHNKEYLCNVGKSSLTGNKLVFDDGFGNSVFSIEQNNGEITLTDSNGNSSSVSYVLKSTFNQTVRDLYRAIQDVDDSQLRERHFKTITTQKESNVSLIGEGTIDATVDIDESLNAESTNPVQNSTLTTEFGKKQAKLVPGSGISIEAYNDGKERISSTLDVEPFVILQQSEFPPSNPSSNKVYIVVEKTDQDTYRYTQYIYRNGQWIATNNVAPEIDLTSYLTKSEAQETYQPIGNYVTTNYLNSYTLSTILPHFDAYYDKEESDLRYQPKGDYATKTWCIEQFVKRIEVYTPEQGDLGTNEESEGQNNPSSSGPSNIIVDDQISLLSTNPVQNRVIALALNTKVDEDDLENYATKGYVDGKLQNIQLSGYVTDSELEGYLDDKQDVLTPGNGISIVNNTISCTLDTGVFVIVEELPSNPDPNKVYLLYTVEGNSYTYYEYRWDGTEWHNNGERNPSINLSEYIKASTAAQLYQPIGNYVIASQLSNYATTSDLSNLQSTIDSVYQKKGDYASRDYVASAIEYVQGVIDRKYVLKTDVYSPADYSNWSTETPTPLDIPTEGGDNSSAYSHIFLEQDQYDQLTSYDANTIYFIYEESEDQPSGSWEFGDSFPIILT